jgi:regulator of sigma E protease
MGAGKGAEVCEGTGDMTIIYAAVLLGILIFVHELGHFLLAKMLGVKVLKFSLGFGPKVVGKTYGETEYCISAVPLGGFVKMLGEEPGEEIPEAERERAYGSQPVWKRFAIVCSGPLFNLVFAVLVFFLIFVNGVPYLLPEVGTVTADSPAYSAGIKKGDRIVEINGAQIKKWEDMTSVIHPSAGKEIRITIQRGTSDFALSLTPEKKAVKDIFGEEKTVGLIGITPSGRTSLEQTSIAGALSLAFTRTWEISSLTLVAIVKLIQHIIPASTIGGPIMIVDMAGKQASQGAVSFFAFMAIISINLGILNLLPIPILDGGHLMFLGIEFFRGRPVSEKVFMFAQRVGLALLVTLMVFAFYNDIIRMFTGTMSPK